MAEQTLGPIVGAVPVVVTPFDDDGLVDEDSLRRQLDFCVDAGSQAIAFGWGSESHLLTDAERAQVWSVAVRHINGHLPVVAATSHTSREGMIVLTHMARECGADCAMVNPEGRRGERLVTLFRDLSQRVGLPLMIQDAQGNAPVDDLLQTVREAHCVVSLKVECSGAPHKMGLLVEGLRADGFLGGDRPVTVLGGSNGGLLPEELDRGAVGTLPHPAMIDAFRTVCDRHAAGDHDGVWAEYLQRILPLNRLTAAGGAAGGGVWLHKTIFQRAGILHSNYCRVDAVAQPEWVMEKVWEHLRKSDLLIASRLGR